MQTHAEPRFKKRVPCELLIAGSRHPGIVLNLSRSGLFVQTAIAAHRGDPIGVDLNIETEGWGAIELDAVVMWNRKVGAQFRGVRHGGVGLQIRNAGSAYYELLSDVALGTGTVLRSGGGENPLSASAPKVEVVSGELYRVRIGLRDTSRSRTVTLRCSDESEARARALSTAGSGTWDILEISVVAAPEEAE